MVGGDICLLMGWQCLNWLRRGEDGDVADIVPCGRCDLKVYLNYSSFRTAEWRGDEGYFRLSGCLMTS